ncbi:hypothetical protein Aglo03_11200 [Actinokineospora globicatena]|uniref:RHS repeat-associated core domain-containing protein n=1 Tax=Actinokineospora globicatena TaxID=103729 RepID=A0A9W6V7U9_9PSEU|nr:hypothetical protein Aglo03_11200 [Actinokineospora globicatena]
MVGADGSVARYTYDAAGNALGVERLGTPTIAVLSVVPSVARPGDTVALSGKGFATTTAANTVKVNGTTATVKTAAADRVTFTVPTAATTGAVTLATTAGTATGPVLTVVRNDKPAITDFTPKTATAGSTITVTASNTDPEFANNLVRVNGTLATVTARNGNTLTIKLPPNAASGTVQLSTPAGTATSSAVLVVPPAGIDPASIDTAAPITPGTATAVPVAAGKWALRYFTAVDNERFAVSLSGGTFGYCGLDSRVYDERNRQTGGAGCVGDSGWIDTSPTSGAGLRSVLLYNGSSAPGTTNLTVLRVPADLNAGAQSLSGTAKTVTIANPGQNAYTTFTGTVGQRVIIQSSEASSQFGCCGMYWWLTAPDGSRVGTTKYPNDTLDTTTLTQAGTYRISMDPSGANTGSVKFSAWTVAADVNAGTQALNGTAKTVSITNPGRNAYTTFAGTVGQRVIIQSSEASSQFGCCGMYWWLVAPDGTRVGNTKYPNDTLDTITLPQAGTYRIVVDPSAILVGSVVLKAWSVPADLDAGTLPMNGTAKVVTIANVGQDGYVTFAGTTGQRVILQSSDTTPGLGCCGASWQVLAPDGTRLHDRWTNDVVDTFTLPQTGTYKVWFGLRDANVGATTFTAWTVPADADLGAIALDGTPKTVSITNVGQDGYLTFSGTTGQRVIVENSGTSANLGCCGASWQVLAPDGTRLHDRWMNEVVDTFALPQDGTYRIWFGPRGTAVGSTTFAVRLVPTDNDAGPLALDGTAKTVTVTNPGQDVYVTFTGTAGQRVILQSTDTSPNIGCCNASWQVLAPDGTQLHNRWMNEIVDTFTLPQTGGYKVWFGTRGTHTGSTTFKAWTVPADADAGTVTLDGTPKTVTVSNVGQDAYITFAGTAGQRVLLQSSDTSGNLGCCNANWQVFAPDGTQLHNRWMNEIVDTFTLPQSGSYRIWFGPREIHTGTTTFKAWTVPADADAGTLAVDGTPKTVTVSNIGQDAYVTFSGTTGQRVLVQSSDTAGNLGCCNASWQVFAPDGTQLHNRWMNEVVDTVTLPQTGAYRIWFGPRDIHTGSTTFKVWTVPADADAGTLALDGTPKTVAVANIGQDAYITFSGTTGQRVILQSADTSGNLGCCNATWQVFAPDGTQLHSRWMNETVDTFTLPQTGSYRVWFGPREIHTGTTTFKAWAVPADADTGTLALDGTPKTIVVTNTGQDSYATFSGTTGQRVILQSSDTSANLGCCNASWQVLAPDGTQLHSRWMNETVDTFTLPQNGSYKVWFGLRDTHTGSTTFKAWSVPADADAGTLALDGTPKTITVTNTGQDSYATFSGTAGQRVIVQSSDTSANLGCCNASWQVLAPDGTRLHNRWMNETVDTFTLPQTGSYKVWFGLRDTFLGATTFKAWTVPADLDAGPITLDGTGKVVSVTDVGRDGYVTFAGTAGQRARFQSLDTTPALGCCNASWQIVAPDGTQLHSRWMNDSVDTFALPQTGTYKVWFGLRDTYLGATTFKAWNVTTAAPAVQPRAKPAEQREPRVSPREVPAEVSDRTARVDPDPASPNAATLIADDRLTAAWTPDAGNLAGADWLTRRGPAPATKDLSAPQGTTAVSGHVLGLDAKPLPGIPVRIDSVKTTTDAQGRFLLEGVRRNATTVIVDGYAADTGKTKYGTFRVHARVVEGATTPLDAPVWLPKLDMAHTVKLSAPTSADTVLTTPAIPGLEVRVPAGTVVRDLEGKVVTELGITAIPLDRPPYPLPRNGIVPTYFTVQPGGSTIFPQGASVVYPNYTKLPAGTVVDFWNYDPVEKQWYVYGHGKVNADASRVIPDDATKLWTLDGAMFNTGGNPKPDKPWWQDLLDKINGDPVDLSTGLLTDSHTDLGLADTVPISLNREYWQGDNHSREFGLNSGADFNMYMASENQYQEVDVYTPGGGRAHYVRTSPGNGYSDAVFAASGSPGRFTGSTITQVNGDWVLAMRDGTKWFFPWYARARAMQDRNGNQVTFVRPNGSNGEVSQIVSPNGRWIGLEYDASARVIRASDNIGRAVSYTYDTVGRLATVTDVAGKVSTYTYDTANRVTRITDGRGVAYLDVVYDANGRVQRQNIADGGSYQFAYTLDASNNVTETRVTQPNGSVQRVTFDANRMLETDTQAFGTSLARTTTYTRGPDNRLDAAIDPYGRRTDYTYDAAGQITKATGLAGTANSYTATQVSWGAFSQPLTTTDAAGKVSTFTYDAKGNLLTAKDPLNRTTTLTRNSAGQVTGVTDAAGAATTFTWEAGNQVAVRDPLGRTSSTFYDSAGRPVQWTDANGARKLVAYDVLNQPVRVTDPLGGVSTFTYDANGNRLTYTDARGKTTRWAYDNADRATSRVDPLNRTSTTSYDAAGRVTAEVTRAGIRNEFSYDALDRPTRIRYGVTGASTQQSQITYGYDSTDRLATLTDTAGGTTTNTYDAFDRVVSIAGLNGTIGYAYDILGRPTSVTLPGLPATTYTYDNADQLTGITRGSDSLTVTRDNAGRPTALALPGGWTQTLTRNAGGQVTGIAYAQNGTAKGALAYAYDPVGRRTSVSGSLAQVTMPAARSGLVYDDANRLVSAGGTALTYDHDGNLLNDGSTAHTWNARGELTGTATTNYTYGPTGVRDSRTVGGTTTKFLYDGDNAAIELDGTGTLSAGLLSAGTDQWVARSKAGITDTVLTDALGTPIALGRADGSLSATTAYDPFGVPTTTGDARGSDLSFTGRQHDGTGLLQYRSRYYSPALGRFISEDPTGFAGGGNLYAYTGNQPTNATDPTGNNPLLACLGGAALDGGLEYLSQRLSGRKVDWGWGGVGGAAAGGCLGGLTGGLGKWLRGADNLRDVQNGWRAAAGKGWKPGQDVYSKTAAGNDPAWSTVRSRFWKNTAEHPQASKQWSDADLSRMRSGKPPTRYNADKGGMESMELSHEPIPMRDGGRDVVPRWPQDHARVDPFRKPGY